LPAGSKKCTMCGMEKLQDDFHLDKQRRDGHRPICKKCACIKSREYRQKHKDEIRISQREYRKTHKEEILKQHRTYYRRTDYHKKYYHIHKERILEIQRKYELTAKGRLRIIRGNHRRRVHVKDTEATLTVEQWGTILKMQKNACNICGRKFTKKRPPTIDHIIPLSRGGGLTYENIQALCKSCNSQKHTKIDPQFIQSWCYIEVGKVLSLNSTG